MLDRAQREEFLARGFLRVGKTFSRQLAASWWAEAQRLIREDPRRYVRECANGEHLDAARALDVARPETWFRERITFHGEGSHSIQRRFPRAWAPIRELMGGSARIAEPSWGNYLAINLDRGQDGPASGALYHWDDPQPRATLATQRLGLVVLALLSDVPPGAGGTMLAAGSHTHTARLLAARPEGVDLREPRTRFEIFEASEELVEIGGEVGDTILVHPLVLHARGSARAPIVRVLANPNLFFRQPMHLDPSDAPGSLVEEAVLRAIARPRARRASAPSPARRDVAEEAREHLASGRVLDALALEDELARAPESDARALAEATLLALRGQRDAAWSRLISAIGAGTLRPQTAEAFASALDRPDLTSDLEIATTPRAADDAPREPALSSEDGEDPAAIETRARSLLWRARLEAADAAAARLSRLDPSRAAAPRIHAAVRVLSGRAHEALPLLDAALALDPRDQESMLWRAEALLATSDPTGAHAWIDRAVRAGPHGFPLSVLRARIEAELIVRGEGDALLPFLRDRADLEQRYPSLFGPHLDRWASETEQAAAILDAEARLALTTRILASLGGNRTADATAIDDDGASLVPLVASRSARRLSDDALKGIVTSSPRQVLASLDALAERFPTSPHPVCFRGELRLWLGEHRAAREDFERAAAIERTRWAFVGLAAAHLLEGDLARADEAFAECAKFPPLDGATVHAYLGEALRLRRDHGAAIAELETAVASRPRRAGAWIDLALARAAAGLDHAADEALIRARDLVPGLLWYAARRTGTGVPETMADPGAAEVLLSSLEIMRGNRSSQIVTFVDDDGELRVLPRPEPLAALCREGAHRAPRVDPAELELARILVGAPALPAPLREEGLRLLGVQVRDREIHLLVGREAALARLRMRARGGAMPFAVGVDVVAVAAIDERLRAHLARLAARLARATTEARWREATRVADTLEASR